MSTRRPARPSRSVRPRPADSSRTGRSSRPQAPAPAPAGAPTAGNGRASGAARSAWCRSARLSGCPTASSRAPGGPDGRALRRERRADLPAELIAAGREGQVQASFVVDTTGRVDVASVQVLASDDAEFTESVRAALGEMRFHPAMRGGAPCASSWSSGSASASRRRSRPLHRSVDGLTPRQHPRSAALHRSPMPPLAQHPDLAAHKIGPLPTPPSVHVDPFTTISSNPFGATVDRPRAELDRAVADPQATTAFAIPPATSVKTRERQTGPSQSTTEGVWYPRILPGRHLAGHDASRRRGARRPRRP